VLLGTTCTCIPHQQDIIPCVVKTSESCAPEDGLKLARNMLSGSWRSIKLLLLHLVGVPYLPTYIDDARSNTNQT
jgi:hypothetical protein